MLRPLSDHELAACRYPTTGAAASPLRQLNARQARLHSRGPDALTYTFLITTLIAGFAAVFVAYSQQPTVHMPAFNNNAGRHINHIL